MYIVVKVPFNKFTNASRPFFSLPLLLFIHVVLFGNSNASNTVLRKKGPFVRVDMQIRSHLHGNLSGVIVTNLRRSCPGRPGVVLRLHPKLGRLTP